MSTTALEDWGHQNRGSRASPGDDSHVDESAISGVGAEDFLDRPVDDEIGPVDEVQGDSDDAELAEKRKKDKKLFMAAGGVAGAIVLAVLGMAVLKPSQSQQQVAEVQQSAPPSQDRQASVLATPQVGAPVVAPLHLGLEAASAAPVESPQASDGSVGLPVGATGVESGVPVAQQLTIASATSAPQPMQAHTSSPHVPQDGPGVPLHQSQRLGMTGQSGNPGVETAEIQKLRDEVAQLKAMVQAKASESKPASAPARPREPKRVVEPKRSALVAQSSDGSSPAVVVITERIGSAAGPTPSAVPSGSTPSLKSKVRTDFRIYAAVDGRFWIVGPDGEPVQIGAASPLSDGSRITSIDTDKNVVHTTAGEIR